MLAACAVWLVLELLIRVLSYSFGLVIGWQLVLRGLGFGSVLAWLTSFVLS